MRSIELITKDKSMDAKRTSYFIAAFICIFFSVADAWPQTPSVTNEEIPDSRCWGNLPPTFYWKASGDGMMINFNPAKIGPVRFDNIPYSEKYTMIVVYKPVRETTAQVWSLNYGGMATQSLTTTQIISDSSAIDYADGTPLYPVINTLKQGAPSWITPNNVLLVGDSSLMVSEILYYDHHLTANSIRRIQSALAVRYGITLGPVDYLDSHGKKTWLFETEQGLYHHRIAGLANDTAFCLRQLESRSEMAGSVLTMRADTLSPDGYILIGDNDADLVFEDTVTEDYGHFEILSREWLIQAKSVDSTKLSLTFDITDFPTESDSLVLILDEGLFLPSLSTSTMALFNGIPISSGQTKFSLAAGGQIRRMAESQQKSRRSNGDDSESTMFSCLIYPNPSHGNIYIDIDGTKLVSVEIYDVHGKLIKVFNGSDQNSYRFIGKLPAGNTYYAVVHSDNGIQTTKIVVE